MRNITRSILITILLVFPTYAMADDWDKYLQYTDRFYNLDKQEFRSISCTIEVSLTKNQVKQLHEQFDPMKNTIEFKENLADFSVTYNRNSGINFNQPSLDIKIISEKGMPDPSKVKKGIELVKAGFKQQIQGTVMQLQGLFEGLETPKKNRHKIKEIRGDKSSYTVIYEKVGNNFTEVYSNKQRKIIQISKNGDKTSSIEKYINIADNKLLLTDVEGTINNAMSKIEMNMKVSYEKVKDIVFPTHIESHFKQSIQTTKQEGQFDIDLKNCRMQ